MTLRVHFDSQAFAMQAFGGVSRYIVELALGLNELAGVAARVIAPLHINGLLSRSDVPVRWPSFQAAALPVRVRKAVNLWLDDLMAATLPGDVLHQTYYRRSRSPRRAVPLVTTVHDMIHEKFPQAVHPMDRSAAMKRLAVAGSDKLICVSEHTRNDLCDILNVPAERVSVIHHGVRWRAHEAIAPHRLARPYVLHVGARARYKNFSALLRAFAADARLSGGFSLVAFGDRPFAADELDLARELQLDPACLVHLSGDDALLDALYRGAACFAYPSLYEGFGMPLLEAMVMHCPVVAARASCIPEVAGDAAEYFEPDSVDSLVQALNAVLFDNDRRDALVRAGAARALAFSWNRAAALTAQVYRDAT